MKKTIALLLITLSTASCAGGYHSYTDGQWHEDKMYCPKFYAYDGKDCVPMQGQSNIYLMGQESKKEQSKETEFSEESAEKEIATLMKKVMLSRAKKEIEKYNPVVKFGSSKYSGSIQMGNAEVKASNDEPFSGVDL